MEKEEKHEHKCSNKVRELEPFIAPVSIDQVSSALSQRIEQLITYRIGLNEAKVSQPWAMSAMTPVQ